MPRCRQRTAGPEHPQPPPWLQPRTMRVFSRSFLSSSLLFSCRFPKAYSLAPPPTISPLPGSGKPGWKDLPDGERTSSPGFRRRKGYPHSAPDTKPTIRHPTRQVILGLGWPFGTSWPPVAPGGPVARFPSSQRHARNQDAIRLLHSFSPPGPPFVLSCAACIFAGGPFVNRQSCIFSFALVVFSTIGSYPE